MHKKVKRQLYEDYIRLIHIEGLNPAVAKRRLLQTTVTVGELISMRTLRNILYRQKVRLRITQNGL